MPHRHVRILTPILLAVLVLLACASCTKYMKMDPPSDADKPGTSGDNSCYLATAANMLAGAGYGNGTTLQARGDDIYANLTAHFGIANGGWTDTALNWWLGSSHNTWNTNPYTVVTVYGNKIPKYPWNDANGARFFGNELRTCNFVGLSISWPTNAVEPGGAQVIGSGGHAITAWGDNLSKATLTANPTQVRLTDSDNDSGGDVQNYTYDSFTSPNPGGANEGNGWYFNYDANHPYIKHIVVLSPSTTASGGARTQKVTGSFTITQAQKTPATDLHYQVGTDVDILTYRTELDWATTTAPAITENSPRRKLTVDWDLTSKPVPQNTVVTITTEFILPSWNAMTYENVHFTYPDGKMEPLPQIRWEIKTPRIEGAERIANVTGGHVIGSFDLLDVRDPKRAVKVGEYRLLHEYSFDQSPEEHSFILTGPKGFAAANLRFGHSYGYLNRAELWRFSAWMTRMGDTRLVLGEKPAEAAIVWKGRLPYPQGEDVRGRIRDIKEGLKKQR